MKNHAVKASAHPRRPIKFAKICAKRNRQLSKQHSLSPESDLLQCSLFQSRIEWKSYQNQHVSFTLHNLFWCAWSTLSIAVYPTRSPVFCFAFLFAVFRRLRWCCLPVGFFHRTNTPPIGEFWERPGLAPSLGKLISSHFSFGEVFHCYGRSASLCSALIVN